MPEPRPANGATDRLTFLPRAFVVAWIANVAGLALAGAAALGWAGWELGLIGLAYVATFCVWGTQLVLRQRIVVQRLHTDPERLVDRLSEAVARPLLHKARRLQTEIDARKAVQESLQRRVDSLYRRVAEQADYAAMIAHELRTPLSVIDMAAQALARQSVLREDHAAHRLQRIRRAVWRIGSLAEELHRGARPECPTTPELRPVALTPLLGHVAEHQSADARPVLRVDEEIVLPADPALLEILFANLLDNARKYAPGQPVEIRVWREHGQAWVEVADRGPGLGEDELERVFHRNFRGRGANRAAGTGLGLFVARRIAEDHGGELTVRNRAGGGCCFVLRLPLGA